MKNVTLNFIGISVMLFFTTFDLNAQSVECGFEFGAGSSYIIEKIDNDLYDYSSSLSSGLNFTYHPEDSYFGIRVNVLYVSTQFSYSDLIYKTYFGEVTTVTTSLLLEHLKENKKLNLGYNFGFGLTRENYRTDSFRLNSSDVRNYMSITLSGLMSYKVSERSSIRLTPSLLWTDPINSFQSDNWYNGREDISVLVQLGYTYKLN